MHELGGGPRFDAAPVPTDVKFGEDAGGVGDAPSLSAPPTLQPPKIEQNNARKAMEGLGYSRDDVSELPSTMPRNDLPDLPDLPVGKAFAGLQWLHGDLETVSPEERATFREELKNALDRSRPGPFRRGLMGLGFLKGEKGELDSQAAAGKKLLAHLEQIDKKNAHDGRMLASPGERRDGKEQAFRDADAKSIEPAKGLVPPPIPFDRKAGITLLPMNPTLMEVNSALKNWSGLWIRIQVVNS